MSDEGPPPPEPEPELECEALTEFDFAHDSCVKERLIRRVKTTCNDCIKKAEEVCESKETEPEQLACIEESCGNQGLFDDIETTFPQSEYPNITPIVDTIIDADCESACEQIFGACTDEPDVCQAQLNECLNTCPMSGAGQDFYARCEVQEKKDACFGCLKQNFMPANYAIEIRDYIGRGFIKHPYLLIETIYSRADKTVGEIVQSVIKAILSPITAIFSAIFGGGTSAPDIETYYEYYLNICVGTCPEIMQTETSCANNSRDHEDDGVPLGLICRTFPDKSECSTCDNNTSNLLDFLPSDPDCTPSEPEKKQYGAVNPITLVTNAAFRHRSKYCRALTGHIPYQYLKCSKPQSERAENPLECRGNCRTEWRECTRDCLRMEEGDEACMTMCDDVQTECQGYCEELEPECGDGVVEGSEVCDDSNVTSGDGCSADCLSDETCGNSYTDTAAGEVCDDGNTDPGDGCSPTCQSECGNGVVDTGEVCDDSNVTSGDGCSADCLSDETCGNAYLDTITGEECDDGNPSDADGCSTACGIECTGTASSCGGFSNESGCNSQNGCSWNELIIEGLDKSRCLGTATACDEYTAAGTCGPTDLEPQQGCTWEPGRVP